MNILHLASFNGNIGDNASHLGFYNILNNIISDFKITKLEIRKFYKNYHEDDKLFFDENLLEYINSFDICFIGGGGFLDYWVENSKSGTTIDIDSNLLKRITTPTLFTSIGSKPHKQVPDGNINKFRNFLEKANENKYIHFAFRNDGSVESIKRDLGNKYLFSSKEILDHGFFYNISIVNKSIIHNKYVAINITTDQLEMGSLNKRGFNKKDYYNELKIVVEYIVKELKLCIVFVPHILGDYKAISELLDLLNDNIKRNYITVSHCLQGDKGANYSFSIYKNSEFVIATRFHSNICSISMKKLVIGLAALDRVQYLYNYLGIGQNSVNLEKNFSQKVILNIKNKNKVSTEKLNCLKMETMNYYKNFFNSI